MIYTLLFVVFMAMMSVGTSLSQAGVTQASISEHQLPPTTAVWALKDGTQVTIRPISADESDRQRLYKILKDPDTQKFQRDGKPWPDASIEGTYWAYVTYWKTLKDLFNLGIKPKKISLCFLVIGPKGKIVAMGGIQKSKRDELLHEIYYAILPTYRRQGLGTKIGRFIMDFHRKLYGNKILEATVVPENKPSIVLLKKLGFMPKRDARGVPEFTMTYNRRYDIYLYTPSTASRL